MKFQDWANAKKIHNKFINEILQCKAHVICTNRVKQDYAVETNEKGKAVVTKLGLANKASEGMEYEFTIVFDINNQHLAHVNKDRTGLFSDKADFRISEETGKIIRDWCDGGSVEKNLEIDIQDYLTMVNNSETIEDLLAVWKDMPENLKQNEKIKETFSEKKKLITN